MELAERLRKIMREQFGIESDEQLIKIIAEMNDPDLGIFVTPLNVYENAS